MASLFALSKCVAALNKEMKSGQSQNSFGGNFKITDYVVSVILSQGSQKS
jgi:uncharacterized FlaG/YvyC family protein